VASVALIKDRDTGRSKGFAFVEMTTQAEAEKAISTFNGYRLGNREIKVNIARPGKRATGGWYTDVPKKNYDNRNRKNTKRR
jgi:RNA recognition motif-containing protein